MPNPKDSAILNALLLCETVIRDARTGGYTFVQCFAEIAAPQLPLVVQKLCVHASVTNLLSNTSIRMEVHYHGQSNPVVAFNAKTSQTNPGDQHELTWDLGGVQLAEPGQYEVRLYSEDKLIGSRPFLVAIRDLDANDE